MIKVKNLIYYEPYKSTDGSIYSCDMIRLKFVFDKKDDGIPLDFMYYMNMHYNFKCDNYKSNRISGFKYMFVFTRDYIDYRCVIKIGFFANHKDSAGYNSNFIEFNPNKCDMHVISYLFRTFSAYSVNMSRKSIFELVRYDLAIDIPVNRSYVKLLKTGKRSYTRIEDKGVTEYLGKRGSNGATKVYDKTKESDLYYDLTRIEITCDSLSPVLPEIHLEQYQTSIDFEFDLNSTDKVLVELLRRCDDADKEYWFRQLGRNKREKLKEYIFSDADMFTFDKLAIMHVIDVIDTITNMEVHYDATDIEADKQSPEYYKQSSADSFADVPDGKIKDIERIFERGITDDNDCCDMSDSFTCGESNYD